MRSIFRSAVGFTFLISVGIFAQSAARKTLHGHVPGVVSHVKPIGHYTSTNQLHLAIGLPVRNQGQLDELLHQLYDPTSPNFHRFLTPQEYTERFGPTEEEYQSVARFAESQGLKISGTHSNRVVLDVEGSVSDVERAFQTKLNVYQHPTEARTFYAPDVEPSVGADISVLRISGLDNFSVPHPKSFQLNPEEKNSAGATPKSGSGPSGYYAGNDFRAAYVPGTTLTGAGQSVALLEFDGYYTSDITSYEHSFGLPSVTLANVAVDGGVSKPGSGNSEVALDIEMVIAMAPGVSQVLVYEAPNSSPWPDILNRIANDNLAKQISCSWGGGGPDPTSEQIFKQMSAQGQSFFNASGDSDAFTSSIPFPSDSTNITQVGATTLSTTGPGGAWSSETVWNWGRKNGKFVGSSGGVSTTYAIPDWQKGISMTTNHGSTTMRNVPDVALTGDNIYVTYNNGSAGAFGGTSCAAPLWAAVTALINQQATLAGRPTVGFVNPAIYSIGKGTNFLADFHDIVTGNNFTQSSPNNFPAVSGYDLCTGWGVPKGTNLINALAPYPYIITPPGSQTVASGTNVSFSVGVGGQSPFTFQWLFNGTNLSNGGNISGATSSVLTLSSVTTSKAGNYKVIVANTSGFVTSSVATLTVTGPSTNHAPVLATISNMTINEQATFSFTASASDSDSGQILTFSLDVGAPSGASITTNGNFSWTPSEAQGPSTNSITVRVTDNGTPALSDAKTFTVTVSEVNTAPILTDVTNRTVNEGVMLTVTNVATDSDIPANTITYSLGVGAPTGVAINSGSGVLTWTPTENQGPGVYSITVIATDNGSPVLSSSNSFSVTVNEVNVAPTLTAISNQIVNEEVTLTITNVATDPDIPANTITYSLGVGAPSGAAIDSGTGVFTWTPTESQGPGVYSITVIATDNGSPVLSSSNSFSITVNEVNVAPTLGAITNQVVNEGVALTITNVASDPDIPANTITYLLDTNAPAGAAIDSGTGVFTWTPTESQGPGVYSITVIATDNGSPVLSSSNSFSVTVNEVNLAPVLAAILTRTVYAGSLVLITNTATDADVSTNILTFSLTNAPAGMSIDPSTGVTTWTPTDANADSTNTFTVQVTDNGSPNLSDSQTGTVIVLGRPTFLTTTTSNSIVTLTWTAIPQQSYRVQYKNDLSEADWTNLGSDVQASGSTASTTDSLGTGERFYRIVLP